MVQCYICTASSAAQWAFKMHRGGGAGVIAQRIFLGKRARSPRAPPQSGHPACMIARVSTAGWQFHQRYIRHLACIRRSPTLGRSGLSTLHFCCSLPDVCRIRSWSSLHLSFDRAVWGHIYRRILLTPPSYDGSGDVDAHVPTDCSLQMCLLMQECSSVFLNIRKMLLNMGYTSGILFEISTKGFAVAFLMVTAGIDFFT